MAVASTIFPPARPTKRGENQAIDPKQRGKAQDFDSCIVAAVPCVALQGSSAHSRKAESDSFLARAATKKRLSSVSTRRCTPSLLSALLGTRQPGVVRDADFFRSHKISRPIRGFPIEPKAVFFNQIESNSIKSIHKKK